MKHLFIRPESKVKDKLGRGVTIVLHDNKIGAVITIMQALRDLHGYTAESFAFDWSDATTFKIIAFNDHDYYRWLDILNKDVYYVTFDNELHGAVGKSVLGNPDVTRYTRDSIETMGWKEECAPLISFFPIELVRAPIEQVVDEPYVPLVEIVDFGDTYDLPIGGSFKHGSMFLRFIKFLASLGNDVNNETIGQTRKPFVVFESCLGGNIGIYKSLTTDKEVDVAFFNRYGELVNVFSFQDGCPHVNGINGLTIEDLISIGTWRILHLNNAIHADENIEAVRHLNSAVDSLNQRTMKRVESLLAKDNVPLND